MSGGWTKGPWSVDPNFSQDHGQFIILGSDGVELGRADAWIMEHRAEAKANAHLIAAAPALAEALDPEFLEESASLVEVEFPLLAIGLRAKAEYERSALSQARGEGNG